MKTPIILFLLVAMTTQLKAQGFYEYFYELEELQCPFQSGSTVLWPVGWSAYHTKNNLWDGEVDSAWCISLELVVQAEPEYYMYIQAEEIDGDRPVFIRTRNHPDLPMPIDPNMLLSVSGVVYLLDDTILDLGTGSPPASGVILSIDIPDEDGVGRTRRNNMYEFQDTILTAFFESCFATEKFEEQYLQDVVIALALRQWVANGYVAELEYIQLQPNEYSDILSKHEVDIEWWEDTSYVVPVYALRSLPVVIENYILPYTSQEYPSSQNISYYDLSPVLPSDTAVSISVVVEEYMSLVPQPFTALRGGLVSGSDTLRHQVELINNGGNLCIELVELGFEDDTKYIHRSGTIDIATDAACMMFKAGAAMEIADNSYLEYGRPGKGFLAMKQGSQLILHTDASITIQNTLVLQLSPTTHRAHPVVFLYPGSTLKFSESAHLEAWGSADLRLEIMMLGGTLDIDALDANERALIEITYPSEITEHLERGELIVVPDPPDHIRILYNAEYAGTGTIYIVDLMGRVLMTHDCDVVPGQSEISVDTGVLLPGCYGVILETEGRSLVGKVVL